MEWKDGVQKAAEEWSFFVWGLLNTKTLNDDYLETGWHCPS